MYKEIPKKNSKKILRHILNGVQFSQNGMKKIDRGR